MSRYIRPRIPGASVFFTVCLVDRTATTLVDQIDLLRWSVGRTLRERPVQVDAWVVLPNHMHAVWTLPVGDSDYGKRWGAIKSRFTRALRDNCKVGFNPTLARQSGHAVGWNPTLQRSESKVRKGDAGIWQRRFWEHHIRSPAEWRAAIAQCHDSPVQLGLVKRLEDWAYSTIHRQTDFETVKRRA